MKIEQILSGIFQVAGDAPELNMSNYSEDEVERLNDAMIDIHNLAKQAYDTRTESELSINYDGLLAVGCPKCGCNKITGDGTKSWCLNSECDFIEAT